MLKGLIRKEREIELGDICFTKQEVSVKIVQKKYSEKYVGYGRYKDYGISEYTMFYVVSDNYLGLTNYCVIIPLKCNKDPENGTYNYNKAMLMKSSKKRFIVEKTSMRKFNGGIYDILNNYNVVNAKIKLLRRLGLINDIDFQIA